MACVQHIRIGSSCLEQGRENYQMEGQSCYVQTKTTSGKQGTSWTDELRLDRSMYLPPITGGGLHFPWMFVRVNA